MNIPALLGCCNLDGAIDRPCFSNQPLHYDYYIHYLLRFTSVELDHSWPFPQLCKTHQAVGYRSKFPTRFHSRPAEAFQPWLCGPVSNQVPFDALLIFIPFYVIDWLPLFLIPAPANRLCTRPMWCSPASSPQTPRIPCFLRRFCLIQTVSPPSPFAVEGYRVAVEISLVTSRPIDLIGVGPQW